MQRLTIRRFDIVRTANITAAIYVLIALVFGLFIFLPFALVGIVGSRVSDGEVSSGAILGAGLIGGLIFYVVIVVFYAIAGWIFGAILAALYNFVAGRIGGLQLDVAFDGPSGGGPGMPVGAYAAGYPAPGYNPYPQGYAPAPGPAWPAPGTPGGPPSPPA
jgi:hypothetical protein